MTSPLKFLTRRRIRLLKLMWRGVREIDSLSDLMFSKKNVIIRDLRALELSGIVEIKSNTAEIVETPENLSLLVFLGIARLTEIAERIARRLTELLEEKTDLKVERVELSCDDEGPTLRLYISPDGPRPEPDTVEYILETLKMEGVKVEFISIKGSFNS